MRTKGGGVKYQVLREYADEQRLFQAIALSNVPCNREALGRLGRQLAERFRDKRVVIVDILGSRTIAPDGADGPGTANTSNEKAEVVHLWHAHYIKSRDVGLHQITIYPEQEESAPDVIRYS